MEAESKKQAQNTIWCCRQCGHVCGFGDSCRAQCYEFVSETGLEYKQYLAVYDCITHYSGQVHGRPGYNLYYGQPITADLAA